MDQSRRLLLQAAMGAAAAVPAAALATARDWGNLPHYPDADIEALDKRFTFNVNTGAIERIAGGCRWCEGPVYFRDLRCLIWSDVPNDRMMRWNEEDGAVSVFRQSSHYSNGNTRDNVGRLVSCEHDTRRVTRTELDGSITVLMERYGAIWFTDPGYGILGNYESSAKRTFELPTNVYRLNPLSNEITVVASDFVRPNGLAFSPDEKRLYIVDSDTSVDGSSHIRVFEVVDGKRLRGGKVFARFASGNSDGLRVDVDGNLWCTYGWGDPKEDGVRCYTPEGDLIGKIHLPETPANLTFGGLKKNRLFICASTSIYSVYLNVVGAQKP